MTGINAANDLHELSFRDLSGAIQLAKQQGARLEIYEKPQISPLTAHFAITDVIDENYLEFVYEMTKLIGASKYNAELEDCCLEIQRNIRKSLQIEEMDESVQEITFYDIQKQYPNKNLKMYKPRNLNDVISLFMSDSFMNKELAFMFLPLVFQMSPKVLEFNSYIPLLKCVEQQTVIGISAIQLHNLKAQCCKTLCVHNQYLFCLYQQGSDSELAGAILAIEDLCGRGENQKALYINQHIEKLELLMGVNETLQ